MPRQPGGMWLLHLLSSLVVRCGLINVQVLPLLRPCLGCRMLVRQQCVISFEVIAGFCSLIVQSDGEADELLQQGHNLLEKRC